MIDGLFTFATVQRLVESVPNGLVRVGADCSLPVFMGRVDGPSTLFVNTGAILNTSVDGRVHRCLSALVYGAI